MKRILRIKCFYFVAALLMIAVFFSCSKRQLTIKNVMDGVVTRLYETKEDAELSHLADKDIMAFITPEERQVLATKYWCFDVNVPAIVSVMRHKDQKVVPFWLEKAGFKKTDKIVKNEEYTYEVWQKLFDAGRIELGINGFDKHRPHYFVSVGPQKTKDQLELSRFYPENQHVEKMDIGAFTYHDWDELVLTEVPDDLIGHKLLTTIRGRAREAHVINAFRKTPFPSSEKPDQVLLTWSGDPRTTQTIQWRISTTVQYGMVRYWEKNGVARKDTNEVKATCKVLEDRLLQNDRYVHRFNTVIRDLKPATTYQYIVGNPEKDVWSEQAEFLTAPSNMAPFTFVYFGDTHRSPQWGQLINTVFERHPYTAFYTVAGDNVSTGLYRDDWDHYFNYSADVIRNKPLMPTLGNHDDQDGLGAWMYFDLFGLPENGPKKFEPERAYSFEYSNALFLMLDATHPVDIQARWLEEKLSKTTATWKFAVFHFPPYMFENEYVEIRQKWGALFDTYHVDMVMSGHVHTYVRSKPMYDGKPVTSPKDGTVYLVSIAIPNKRDEFPDEKYTEISFGGEMLYQTFDIDGNRLVYRSLNIDGEVRDELVIEK